MEWYDEMSRLIGEAKERFTRQQQPSRGFYFEGGYYEGLREALEVGPAGLAAAIADADGRIHRRLRGAMNEGSSPVIYQRGRQAALLRALELTWESSPPPDGV